MSEWKRIANDPWTCCMEVPGGWLYLVRETDDSNTQTISQSMAFVPKRPANAFASWMAREGLDPEGAAGILDITPAKAYAYSEGRVPVPTEILRKIVRLA